MKAVRAPRHSQWRQELNLFRPHRINNLEVSSWRGDVKRNNSPTGCSPDTGVIVEAASPIFRYARTFQQFKNGQCNTVTEFGN